MNVKVIQQLVTALEFEDMACRYMDEPTPEHIKSAIEAGRREIALYKMAENERELGIQMQPTGTERLVCEDISKRQELGMKKYGTTVCANTLSLREWLQHAYEECLDQAVYLRRAMQEMDKEGLNEHTQQ